MTSPSTSTLPEHWMKEQRLFILNSAKVEDFSNARVILFGDMGLGELVGSETLLGSIASEAVAISAP